MIRPVSFEEARAWAVENRVTREVLPSKNPTTWYLHQSGHGIIGILRRRNVARLRYFAVAAAHRGNGIGTAMFDAAVEVARTIPGVTVIDGFVRERNLPFYQKRGFKALRHGTVYRIVRVV